MLGAQHVKSRRAAIIDSRVLPRMDAEGFRSLYHNERCVGFSRSATFEKRGTGWDGGLVIA